MKKNVSHAISLLMVVSLLGASSSSAVSFSTLKDRLEKKYEELRKTFSEYKQCITHTCTEKQRRNLRIASGVLITLILLAGSVAFYQQVKPIPSLKTYIEQVRENLYSPALAWVRISDPFVVDIKNPVDEINFLSLSIADAIKMRDMTKDAYEQKIRAEYENNFIHVPSKFNFNVDAIYPFLGYKDNNEGISQSFEQINRRIDEKTSGWSETHGADDTWVLVRPFRIIFGSESAKKAYDDFLNRFPNFEQNQLKLNKQQVGHLETKKKEIMTLIEEVIKKQSKP